MKSQDFQQKLSMIILRQQESTPGKATFQGTQTALKQVKGNGLSDKPTARKLSPNHPPRIEIDDIPVRLSQRPMAQKTPISKQQNPFSLGVPNGPELFATPNSRANRIKTINLNTSSKSMRTLDPYQELAEKFCKGIQANGASKEVQQQQEEQKIFKIQAIFRRRLVQKLYKKMLKINRYRVSVFNELIKTEEAYVQDLKLIDLLFVQEIQRQNVLDKAEIQKTFMNIKAIIELNENMLKELKQQPWHPNKQMIRPIVDYAHFFKIYFEYCNNYQNMCTLIERFRKTKPRFDQLFKQVNSDPKLRNLGIESFLVKPVQRLPKYVLLLKDYLKHTEPDHVDYLNIKIALQNFNKVNDENNMHMDRVVVNAKMFELQKAFGDQSGVKIVDPKRDFITEEPMTVFHRNQAKSVIVYFFSDVLVIAERELSTSNNQQLKLLTMVNISESSQVKNLQDTQNFKSIFGIVGDNETVTFQAFDEMTKKRIIQVIEQIIQKLQDLTQFKQKTFEKLSKMSIHPSQKKWKIEVEVIGSEERISTVNNYTVYIIQIAIEGIECNVFLRYSEFTDIQSMTKKNFQGLQLPYASEKTLFGNHESKVIEARKLQIQNFLSTLLGHPDFYDSGKQKEIAKTLKFIGLPQNFYQLPSLLKDYENLIQREAEEEDDDRNKSVFDKQLEQIQANEEKAQQQQQVDPFSPLSALIGRKTDVRRRGSTIKTIQQGKNISILKPSDVTEVDQVERINSHLIGDTKWQFKTVIDLPRPDELEQQTPRDIPKPERAERNGRSVGRGLSDVGRRRVSATKLIQSTSQTRAEPASKTKKFPLIVKLSHSSVEVMITDECRAIQVAEEVSLRVGLVQYYDFRFVDERSGRYIQDDELLLSLYQRKDSTIYNKFKQALLDKFTILFRKVLFLPKMLEMQEYLQDNVRLKIIVNQLTQDIMNISKMTLSFKEYCNFAGIQIYIYNLEHNPRPIDQELLTKFIPQTLLKATKKEIWIQNVDEVIAQLATHLQFDEYMTVEKKLNTAYRVLMTMAQNLKLYGMTLYQAENSLDNKYKKPVPQQVLIGVNIDGLHILDPKKKIVLKSFYNDKIEIIKVYTNSFQVEIMEQLDENTIYRFSSPQSYQIYQLYDEYQQVQFEIQAAQQGTEY